MRYQKAVLKTHCFVPKRELQLPVEQYRSVCTIYPTFGGKDGIPTYRETQSWFGFPLYYHRPLSAIARDVDDRRPDGCPVRFNLRFELRAEQIDCVVRFTDHLDQGGTGGILDARPGFGKTVCLIHILHRLGRNSLVIVHKTDLVTQWKERLLALTDIQPHEIGTVQQSTCDFRGKKVTIGMLQSIAKGNYSRDFYNHFGVVVFDEIHKIGAPYFSTVVRLLPSKYRLGASATMERRDGTTSVFTSQVGEQVFRHAVRHERTLRLKVYARRYFDEDSIRVRRQIKDWMNDMAQRSAIINRMAEDPKRQRLVAFMTQKLYRTGRHVIVLSHRVGQLQELHELLTKVYNVPDDTIGLYIGAVKDPDVRKEMVSRCKVLLATYQMLSEGTDIETLDGLVFATPQSGVEQSVGRLLRKADKQDPIVVDIVDAAYSRASRWYRSRKRDYNKLNAEITETGGV